MEIHLKAEYKEIVKKALNDKSQFANLPKDCQTRNILNLVANQTLDYANKNKLDAQFLLENSFSFITVLQNILMPPTSALYESDLAEKNKIKKAYRKYLPEYEKDMVFKEWIWKHKDCKLAINSGEESGHYWIFNLDELRAQCYEYLKQPWIHCGAIDRILVDAMIYSSTLDFGYKVKASFYSGSEVINNVLSDGTIKASTKSLIKITLSRLVTVFFAVIIGYTISDHYGLGVGILSGFIFWFLYMIAWHLNKSRDFNAGKMISDKLTEMLNISDMMREYPLSPKYLRERLNRAADNGVIWPVSIFPILDNAISRNVLTWD